MDTRGGGGRWKMDTRGGRWRRDTGLNVSVLEDAEGRR